MAPLSPSSVPPSDSSALVQGDDLLTSLAVQHNKQANGDGMETAAAAGGGGSGQVSTTSKQNNNGDDDNVLNSTSSASAAYAAGERAALARAFREALPSQQALGALANAVTSLQSRAGSSETFSREAAAAAAAAAALARSVDERLTFLENGRLPALEAAGGAKEAAEGLRGVLEALSSSLTKVAESAVEKNNRSSSSLGGVAAALAVSSINAAEAAASRLLLGSSSAAAASSSSSSTTAVALGAALTVASLEALHHSSALVSRNLLPRPLSKAVRPARGAVRVARVVAWGAGAVLAGCALRRACFSVAERATSKAAAEEEGGEEEEVEEEVEFEVAAAAVGKESSPSAAAVVSPEPSLAV